MRKPSVVFVDVPGRKAVFRTCGASKPDLEVSIAGTELMFEQQLGGDSTTVWREDPHGVAEFGEILDSYDRSKAAKARVQGYGYYGACMVREWIRGRDTEMNEDE